jgi:hypothetical protein
MATLYFLLSDIIQVLKLVALVTVPVAILGGVGIWFYLKRKKSR